MLGLQSSLAFPSPDASERRIPTSSGIMVRVEANYSYIMKVSSGSSSTYVILDVLKSWQYGTKTNTKAQNCGSERQVCKCQTACTKLTARHSVRVKFDRLDIDSYNLLRRDLISTALTIWCMSQGVLDLKFWSEALMHLEVRTCK